VAGGYSVVGEKGSIGLSGVMRSNPACGAAGGESGSFSQIIARLPRGMSSAPFCP